MPIIDIVLPAALSEASAKALKLCELFLEALICSQAWPIKISVDLQNKAIRCEGARMREVMRLILGAGEIDNFVGQLLDILHPSADTYSLGELRFKQEGVDRKFVISGDIYKTGWVITAG